MRRLGRVCDSTGGCAIKKITAAATPETRALCLRYELKLVAAGSSSAIRSWCAACCEDLGGE
jgi:hypothetical protein